MQFGNFGLPQILIILVVVLLVFGPRRLPELAKGLGQSVREFRKGIRDMKDEIESEAKDDSDTKKAIPSKSTEQEATDWEALRAEQEKLKREREQFEREKLQTTQEKSSA